MHRTLFNCTPVVYGAATPVGSSVAAFFIPIFIPQLHVTNSNSNSRTKTKTTRASDRVCAPPVRPSAEIVATQFYFYSYSIYYLFPHRGPMVVQPAQVELVSYSGAEQRGLFFFSFFFFLFLSPSSVLFLFLFSRRYSRSVCTVLTVSIYLLVCFFLSFFPSFRCLSVCLAGFPSFFLLWLRGRALMGIPNSRTRTGTKCSSHLAKTFLESLASPPA